MGEICNYEFPTEADVVSGPSLLRNSSYRRSVFFCLAPLYLLAILVDQISHFDSFEDSPADSIVRAWGMHEGTQITLNAGQRAALEAVIANRNSRQKHVYFGALFVAKLRDIVGLYVNPPDRAIVLSGDKRSQIQALDRARPGLPMKRGRGTMKARLIVGNHAASDHFARELVWVLERAAPRSVDA